jgi:hypothetical protein
VYPDDRRGPDRLTSRLTGRARGLYVVRFRGTERRRPFNLVPSLIRILEAAIGCPALFRSTIPESASSHQEGGEEADQAAGEEVYRPRTRRV